MLLLEGWDLYGTTDNVVLGNWTEVLGTPIISLTGGKENTNHVIMNATADAVRFDHANIEPPTQLFVGFQFKADSVSASEVILQWTDKKDANAPHSNVKLLPDGSMRFADNSLPTDPLGVTHGTTASGLIVAGVWYNIEVRILPSTATFSVANADGQFELRIDGTIRLNLTNLSIGPDDLGSPRPVGIGKTELRGSTDVFRFDDIYMFNSAGPLNNGFAGDFRIQTLRPNADAAPNEWIPNNASDSFAEVDDVEPDGDTSYVSSQVSLDQDIYALTNLTGDVGAILGYGPLLLARREVGSTQSIAVRMISFGSNTVDFSGQNLADTYEMRSDLRSGSIDDASNSVAPTIAEVDALTAGVFIPA